MLDYICAPRRALRRGIESWGGRNCAAGPHPFAGDEKFAAVRAGSRCDVDEGAAGWVGRRFRSGHDDPFAGEEETLRKLETNRLSSALLRKEVYPQLWADVAPSTSAAGRFSCVPIYPTNA